jgi:hypothetical protein
VGGRAGFRVGGRTGFRVGGRTGLRVGVRVGTGTGVRVASSSSFMPFFEYFLGNGRGTKVAFVPVVAVPI